jgi:hypothetical protein
MKLGSGYRTSNYDWDILEKTGFTDFQREVEEIVGPLNKKLRAIYDNKMNVVEGLVKPFVQFTKPEGTLKKTEQKLREIIQAGSEEDFKEQVFNRLKKMRNKSLEKESLRIDKILRKRKRAITLGEDSDALVQIDPTMPEREDDFDVTWDAKNERIVVSLSPDLFAAQNALFLGEEFEVIYIVGAETSPGVSINVEEKKIYVNPFNADLTQYSVGVFDVYVVLYIANAISETKNELVKNAMALLGAKSEVTQKYIMPLGDDLRRTLAKVRIEL